MRNWSVVLLFFIVLLSQHLKIPALTAGTLVTLVLLPRHPGYYVVASAIVAKTYSNSMMAVLNSRVRPVSNASASAAPLWNESVKPITSVSWVGTQPGFSFRRDSEMSVISLTRISEFTLLSDITA